MKVPMKKTLFSLSLVLIPLLGDNLEIIDSIPLDDISDIHLNPVSEPTQLVVTPAPAGEVPSVVLVEPDFDRGDEDALVQGLSGMHDNVVTKKSYLKGILSGQQYDNYALADLESGGLVKQFYRKNQYRTIWISSGFDISPNLFELLDMIRNAENEGLESGHYHQAEIEAILNQIKEGVAFTDKERNLALTEIDVLLTDAFLTMAKDLREGKIDFDAFRRLLNKRATKNDINYKWDKPSRTIDYVGLLNKVSKEGNLARSLKQIQTDNELFLQLKRSYARYQNIVAEGGWKKIPGGEQLRKGIISKKRVPLLANRLYMTGDLASYNPNVTVVTQEMKDAIKHFQRRMGIWPSGAVTKTTRAAMNVSAERRLEKIKLNLERMRWEESAFGLDYVYINIPDFKMRFYKDGGKDIEMRVVVGKPDHPTPIFDSVFSYVVLNPTWTVPKSIVKDEMLPRIQEDPDYLNSKKFKVYNSWERDRTPIDPFSVDWWQYDEESTIPYSFVRESGPGNPLGVVKFMFPNKYAVYMHDTPDKRLFKNSRRAYSHGCIRLHKPKELLSYVSDYFMDMPPEEVKRLQKSGETRSVKLNRKIPVHVRYYTAWADDDGAVSFRSDIYGYDQMQYNLLEK